MRSLVTAALAVIFAIFNLALFFAAAVAWGRGNQLCSHDEIESWGWTNISRIPCGIPQWLPYSLLTFLALAGLVISAAFIIRPFLGKGKKHSSHGPLVALLLNLLLLILVFTIGWRAPQLHGPYLTPIHRDSERPAGHTHDHLSLQNHWHPGMAPGGAHHVQPRSSSPSMIADTEFGSKDMRYPHPQSEVEASDDTAIEHGTIKTRAVTVSPSPAREEHDEDLHCFPKLSMKCFKIRKTGQKQKKQGRGVEEEIRHQAYGLSHIDGVTGGFILHLNRGNGAAKAAIVLSHLTFLFGFILALADLLLSDPADKPKKADGPKQHSEEIV